MKPPRGIPADHYSTANLPRADRHEQWTSRGWPSSAALFESTPVGEFSTSAVGVTLNGIRVSYTQGTARNFERSPARIAADGIDVLGAGVILEGTIEGQAGGKAFAARAGEILLLDMSQSSAMLMSASRSIQLAIPRPIIEAEIGPVAALHGCVIGDGEASMLHSHLLQISEALELIPPGDASRVGRTLLDLFVIALKASGLTGVPTAEGAGSALAIRARAEIQQNLGSPKLTIANLCRRLQVSRSTLHRLFDQEGGVQAYIRGRRLDAARLALLDPGNSERIGVIAERLGFSDTAHLSRLFRERYGESPSECRARIAGQEGK